MGHSLSRWTYEVNWLALSKALLMFIFLWSLLTSGVEKSGKGPTGLAISEFSKSVYTVQNIKRIVYGIWDIV